MQKEFIQVISNKFQQFEDLHLPYRLYVITKIRKQLIEELVSKKNKFENNEQIIDMIRQKVIP